MLLGKTIKHLIEGKVGKIVPKTWNKWKHDESHIKEMVVQNTVICNMSQLVTKFQIQESMYTVKSMVMCSKSWISTSTG